MCPDSVTLEVRHVSDEETRFLDGIANLAQARNVSERVSSRISAR
jgi:hypothetical protein